MKNKTSLFVSSFIITLTMAAPQLSYGSAIEEIIDNSGTKKEPYKSSICYFHFAQDVKSDSQTQDLIDIDSHLTQNFLMKPDQKFSKNGLTDPNENIYQIFLNGRLVYKPDSKSDNGKIVFKILDFLPSPFGTFNLSQCGNTAECLMITTDPSVFFEIDETDPKFKILIGSKFLIQRFKNTHTSRFAAILDNWDNDKAPIGLFWTGADYELSSYDYLVSSPMVEMSSRHLYQNWQMAARTQKQYGMRWMARVSGSFMFVCEPKLETIEQISK